MHRETEILKYLRSGRPLTNQSAYHLFHTTELRVYISRLRKRGIDIKGEWCENIDGTVRYKEYWITTG